MKGLKLKIMLGFMGIVLLSLGLSSFMIFSMLQLNGETEDLIQKKCLFS